MFLQGGGAETQLTGTSRQFGPLNQTNPQTSLVFARRRYSQTGHQGAMSKIPSSQSGPSGRWPRSCPAPSYLVLCSSSPARCKSWTHCRRKRPPAAGDGSPSSAPPPPPARRRAALQRDHLRGGDRNTMFCYGYVKEMKTKKRRNTALPSRGSNTLDDFLQRKDTFFFLPGHFLMVKTRD